MYYFLLSLHLLSEEEIWAYWRDLMSHSEMQWELSAITCCNLLMYFMLYSSTSRFLFVLERELSVIHEMLWGLDINDLFLVCKDMAAMTAHNIHFHLKVYLHVLIWFVIIEFMVWREVNTWDPLGSLLFQEQLAKCVLEMLRYVHVWSIWSWQTVLTIKYLTR